MSRRIQHGLIGMLCCSIVASAGAAWAIETTYGEDPVPNSQCYDGFINLGYGIDPIPAKSPYVRWQEWRASRGLTPTVGLFKRQVGESRFVSPQPPSKPTLPPVSQGAALPSSRRNARTKNLPSSSSVR